MGSRRGARFGSQQAWTADGLRASLTDANGNTTAFTYDGFDRLSTTTYPLGSTEGLTYDTDGNVITPTTRAGAPISFAYDTLNRLSTKTPPSPAPVAAYSYDLAGRMTGVSDTSASIASVATPGSTLTYATSFAYDPLNHPTGVTFGAVPAATAPTTGANVAFTHGYNAANQRTSQSVSDSAWIDYPPATASTTAYTANALNQYTAVGAVTPGYNTNGNLTSDGTNTLGYDAENRLTSATKTGMTATYAFDGRGRRKTKTVNGMTTVFVTDADNREVLEYDGSSGAILRWYAYGLGTNDVLGQVDVSGSTRLTPVSDLQGSIIGTMSSAGMLTSFAYSAYGASASAPAAFGYTGQRVDVETVSYYYRARHYSPGLGRFMQADPIGYGDGAHLYAYVQNDPLNLIDAMGLNSELPIGDIPGGDSLTGASEGFWKGTAYVGNAANAVVNGAFSIFSGVGNAFYETARGTGLLGQQEYIRSVQETDLLIFGVQEMARYPQESVRAAREAIILGYQAEPLIPYYFAGRSLMGIATGVRSGRDGWRSTGSPQQGTQCTRLHYSTRCTRHADAPLDNL